MPARFKAATAALLLAATLGGAGAGAKPFRIILPYQDEPPAPSSVVDLADRLGFYKAAGVEVEFVRVASTPSSLAALKVGDGDMANVATGTCLELVARDQMDLRGVISADKALPFVIAAKKDITTPKQLDGKSFGIASIGSTDYLVSRLVLAKFGVDLNSLQFVAVGLPAVRAQALMAGRIDATAFSIGVWTSVPDKSAMAILVDQQSYYNAAPFLTQLDVVLADTMKTKAPEVQAVVRAIMMASRAFAKDPSIWVEAMVKARPDLKREDLEAVARTYSEGWSVNGGLNLTSAQFTTDALYADPQWKDLPVVPAKQWIDTRFVDAVLADSGTVPGIDPTGR
jgi:NitT/TauT family transport system substrate-binding protein